MALKFFRLTSDAHSSRIPITGMRRASCVDLRRRASSEITPAFFIAILALGDLEQDQSARAPQRATSSSLTASGLRKSPR